MNNFNIIIFLKNLFTKELVLKLISIVLAVCVFVVINK